MRPAFAVGADAGRSLLQNIGRYQIESELGKGAMGLVYKAMDPNIGRPVALKTMRLDVHGIEQEEMLRRFKNEARSAGVLNHPNIVTIYDAGEDQGLFYIAMEFIEGKTLAEVLQQHRVLPVDQVIAITRNICAGLDFAHNKGIVHRDIKPANIMVTPDGTAKIMDFGIAKVSGSMTSTGQVLGTPNYMSPEQVKGRQLDGRSDLFSLGVMLYEMLTGEKPFLGQGVTTIIYKIVNENPIPPRDLDLTIHPGLSAVVTRSLAKDPYERYQTGAELVRDLENYKSYGTDANSTVINATGAFDRSAVAGDGDATLIGSAPASRTATPAAAQSTQPVTARTATTAQAAASTGSATARTPALPIPPAVSAGAKAPEVVSQKKTAVGSGGASKLVIGAFAVLVLIAGVAGISRHYARKRAAESTQEQFQQAMQQAQQAIDMAKQAEKLGDNAPPPTPNADGSQLTPANANPEPPATDTNVAPQPDSAAVPPMPANRKTKVKAATGDLQVVSEPAGAHVEIDGQSRPEWVTPFVADKLPTGKHTLTYTMQNFSPVTITAEVPAGKKGTADAKMATTVGTVKLASTPAGADITLNGHATGQKTPTSLSLPPGSHVIKLHKEGFQDTTENITVVVGQTQSVTGKLQATAEAATAAPEPSKTAAPAKDNNPFAKIGRFFRGGSGGSELGTLAVATTPPGAKVILNGEASSTPTPVSIQTKAGKYKIQLVMDGYQTVEREVMVEKGKSTGIAETLVHK